MGSEEVQTRQGVLANLHCLPTEHSWYGGMGRATGLACPLEDGSGDLSWTPLLCRGTWDAEGAGWLDAASRKSVGVAWLGAGREGPAWCEELRLSFPGHPSVLFLNLEGSVCCCPVDAQSGSRDIEAPAVTQRAVVGEKSSQEGYDHQAHWATFHGTSLLQFLSLNQRENSTERVILFMIFLI